MGRPKTRLETLDRDTITQIRQLFGSIRNAHRLLALQLDVPYNTFYVAMQFREITPTDKDAIVNRWLKWREIYLNPACPISDEMQLNPMDIDMEPEWLVRPKKTKTSSSSTRSKAASSG